ncbi:hypothetical protein VE03_10869 [Pseudogymnoascus sp. 23342-1-I1]|nr:hypothetical protein VE03_10869 [Pseudogymnoascus sp. 23342-1-I1]
MTTLAHQMIPAQDSGAPPAIETLPKPSILQDMKGAVYRNQKPFSCPRCNKRFGRQDVLLRHAKLHDNGKARGLAGSSTTPPPPASVAGDSSRRTEEPVVEGAGRGPARLPDLQTDTSHDDGSIPARSETMQSWAESGELLEILMSDFNSSWPIALPVMQFQPSASLRIDGSEVLPPSNEQLDAFDNPGQQAMQQMSMLIGDLSSGLTAEIASKGITSAFLDTCIHVFFDKFMPCFPVLHKPTFLARETSHPLLLNIIALGSLSVAAKDAVPKGEALWRLAHTSVATSWQALIATRGPRDQCNGVQLILTALLGQTYALLSKNASLRTTCQVFHGLGFSWARQCGMYVISEDSYHVPALSAPEAEKNAQWRTWAALEVHRRAILGHYVLDGLISQFSGQPTCVRHVTNPLLAPAADRAFAAATADEWIVEVKRQGAAPRRSFQAVFVDMFSPGLEGLDHHPMSDFAVRVVLEGFQSLISDVQQLKGPAVGTPSKTSIAQALMSLYNLHLRFLDPAAVESMELLVRWHSICLDLATPTTQLCRWICATYRIPQQLYSGADYSGHESGLVVWAESEGGRRALLHAMAIQELVDRLPLGRAHTIHLSAAVFAAASIYSARCMAGKASVAVPASIRWEDAWGVDSAHASFDDVPARGNDTNVFMQGGYVASLGKSVVRHLTYELNSLQIILRSISLRWGVSHEMDAVLHQWIAVVNEGSCSRV